MDQAFKGVACPYTAPELMRKVEIGLSLCNALAVKLGGWL